MTVYRTLAVILSEAAFMPRSRRIPFDFLETPLIWRGFFDSAFGLTQNDILNRKDKLKFEPPEGMRLRGNDISHTLRSWSPAG